MHGKVFGQKPEVCLELQLVEINLCCLEETVFEIVQVKQDIVCIKLRLRVADIPVHATGSSYLDIRKLSYGSSQQFLLLIIVTSA